MNKINFYQKGRNLLKLNPLQPVIYNESVASPNWVTTQMGKAQQVYKKQMSKPTQQLTFEDVRKMSLPIQATYSITKQPEEEHNASLTSKVKKLINPAIKAIESIGENKPNAGSMLVVFPEYSVATGIKTGNETIDKTVGHLPLGHGLVIAVDNQTGETRGSEYGRYDTNKGKARRVRVPSLQAQNLADPSTEELNKYAEALYKQYNNAHKGSTVNVYYVKDVDGNKMRELMESAESNNRKTGFYVNSDYRILDHNCGTYGADMIKEAMPWYKFSGFGEYSWGVPDSLAPYWGTSGSYTTEKK